MAGTGRSSQGGGAGSRAGSGSARAGSSASAANAARGSRGESQAGARGASAREASSGASVSGSGGADGIEIGGSASLSGGSARVSGSAGLGASTGSAGASATGGGASSSRQDIGAQSSASGMDAERQVPIGREGQQQSRGSARSQSASQSSPQGSMQASGQAYGTPFAFMRRFGEEMDRLFSDFGFGPPGIESQLSLLGWPGSSGRSSLSLNANAPRSGGSGVEGRNQAAGASGSAMSRPRSSGAVGSRSSWMPQVEVLQRGSDLVLRADLPGLRREDVHVEIDDDLLTISGERRYESESEEEGLYHSERSYGRFSRSIPLPPGTDEEACQARFTDGVLEVTVPLPQERSRARRIEIR